MIFRRNPPRSDLPVVLARYTVSPEYLCLACEVKGRGDRCWFCGSRHVQTLGPRLIVK